MKRSSTCLVAEAWKIAPIRKEVPAMIMELQANQEARLEAAALTANRKQKIHRVKIVHTLSAPSVE